MARKLKHHKRGEKFEVVYPIDSGEALFRAIGSKQAETVKAAKHGDENAAAELVKEAIMFIGEHCATGAPIPRPVCEWLLHALDAATAGESIEAAMGLCRRGARNVWTLAEKKRAVTLLWAVRDYLKTRPRLQGGDYHEVTARWFSDSGVPGELAGFTDGRASTSWMPFQDGSLPFKKISSAMLSEWEREAVAVKPAPS